MHALVEMLQITTSSHHTLKADTAAAVRRSAHAERVHVALDGLDIHAANCRALCKGYRGLVSPVARHNAFP